MSKSRRRDRWEDEDDRKKHARDVRAHRKQKEQRRSLRDRRQYEDQDS